MTIKAATMQKDCYKEYHVRAYHPEVSEVYTNFTSRSGKLSNVGNHDKVAFVGLQYFIKDYLIGEWEDTFFSQPKEHACGAHKRIMSSILGYDVDVTYLEDLHDLRYLPIKIKALPEGTMVPYQVAPLTVVNTLAGFEWLPNMIETVLSTENWPIQTSATTSAAYMRTFKKYFEETGAPMELLPFMCHDFSFRGMFGRQAAAMSGFGHLASGFAGTDTIPAVLLAEKYYGANVENELVGASVDATEHSVTCSWQEEGEIEFFKYLMKEQSPTGILSVVADSWDFWKLVTEFLPALKDDIMARDGKLVIRPDSGDPVKILTGGTYVEAQDEYLSTLDCTDSSISNYDFVKVGDKYYELYAEWNPKLECWKFSKGDKQIYEHEQKGLIECLWDTFGGTITDKGFKLLDEHIGAIYGDSITLERQEQICQRLVNKGFAPVVVLGVGSYSFQYVTRDTHGSAVKATNVVKAGKDTPIFKDPATDRKKKSAKGLLRVDRDENGELVMYDNQTREQEEQGLLEVVYENGDLVKETTLAEIRDLMSNQ